MNTELNDRIENRKETLSTCTGYIARGGLIWGTVYTGGVSGLVYMIAPAISGEPVTYREVLLNSALICPSIGAAGGYLRWKYFHRSGESTEVAAPPNKRSTINRLKAYRRAAFKKAA